MTNEAELRRIISELDSPLADLGGGIKVLWVLSESFGAEGQDQDALAFLAKTLDDSLNNLHKTHSKLYRAMSSDAESIEPTPLHGT